jgi:transcriptional regulator with XRE-family HTH domain
VLGVTMNEQITGVGPLLRQWRTRRRLSQLDLASAADVSTRHLSYVETGRSTPSRELVLHLARHLDVPLREQNDLLLAAGYAPAFSELDLDAPAMQPVMAALAILLEASEPNPTLVMDRHWNLVLANEAALLFTELAAEHLVEPPLNIVELTLHPEGLAPLITNLDEVAAHMIHRIQRQVAVTGDSTLAALAARAVELVPGASAVRPIATAAAITVQMEADGQPLTLLSVVSTFGTALDVTASELIIETFYDVTDRPSAE